jgi:hypothetical protein
MNADGTPMDPEVFDAIEILRSLLDLPSVFNGGRPLVSGTVQDAIIAANITRRNTAEGAEGPRVHDAIEILRSLLDLPSAFNDATRFPPAA